MLPKLIVIIVVAGATACALLVNRQHRIDTAHEIAVMHQRLVEQEQTLWLLRTEIAQHTRPDRIREGKESLRLQWVSIPTSPQPLEEPPERLAVAIVDPFGG